MHSIVTSLKPPSAAVGLLLMAAISFCSATFAATDSSGNNEAAVGGDRSAHGCIASAGYTWSQLRNDCIRLFEAGVPLYNAQDPAATSVAYVVNGGDQLPLELYLPDKEMGILMFYRDGAWHDDDGRYVLTNDDNDVLDVRSSAGTLLFSSQKPKS